LKKLLFCGLLVLTLVLGCAAIAPMQLSGDSGKAVLANITDNASNQTLKASTGNASDNFWSWGSVPIGYELNKSGDPLELPSDQEAEWTPSI